MFKINRFYDKSQPKSPLMAKRVIEDNNRFTNYNQNINSSINTINNNKRIRIDSNLDKNNNKDLTHVCNGLNAMTTNSNPLNEDMSNSNINNNQNNGSEDDFEDDLNDHQLNELMSQLDQNMVIPSNGGQGSHQNSHLSRNSDHNMSSGNESKSGEDVLMNTNSNGSSGMSYEVSEGRIKILESRNNTLKEEVNRYRTQIIQNQRQTQEIREECNQRIEDLKRKNQSTVEFMQSENQTLMQMIEQLKRPAVQNRGALGSLANSIIRQPNNFQNFSQIKRQEFYAPYPYASQTNSNTILVPESQYSQSTSGCSEGKRMRLWSGFPTEIASTQLGSISTVSQPVPMDTTSSQFPEMSANITETMSQSATQAIKWEPIRVVLQTKFDANREQLSNYFIDQQIDLFSDDWISVPQEIKDYSIKLNELLNELNITAIV